MASTYSPYLRLELIGTGEQTGTWGATTNTNLGTLLDQAVAGTATIDVTLGDVTLTALNGASDQSRRAILKITGTPVAARNVIAPEQSKWYLVSNDCGQTITLKGASTTGYAIADGETLLMFWNGTDFVPGSSTALGYTPVNKAGDTMSGALYLPSATPTLSTQAATKGYVDSAVSGAVGSNFVLKTGDTMTGALVLSGAPSTSLQAATKGYVDSSISGAGYATESWVTNQNYANTSTQSLLYYYTKTDSDNKYVSVNTQNLTYYPLTTTVATTYGAKASSNSWSGSNAFSVGGGVTFTITGAGNTLTVNGNSISSTGTAYVSGGSGTFSVGTSGASLNTTLTATGINYSSGGGDGPASKNFYSSNTGGTYNSLYYEASGTSLASQNYVFAFKTPGSNSASLQYVFNGSGTATAANWSSTSDARIKENVATLQGGLDKIAQLRPVEFSYKRDKLSAADHYGLIAQELEQVLPNIVDDSGLSEGAVQNIKAVSYTELIPILIKAVQELKAEVDALKAAK